MTQRKGRTLEDELKLGMPSADVSLPLGRQLDHAPENGTREYLHGIGCLLHPEVIAACCP